MVSRRIGRISSIPFWRGKIDPDVLGGPNNRRKDVLSSPVLLAPSHRERSIVWSILSDVFE